MEWLGQIGQPSLFFSGGFKERGDVPLRDDQTMAGRNGEAVIDGNCTGVGQYDSCAVRTAEWASVLFNNHRICLVSRSNPIGDLMVDEGGHGFPCLFMIQSFFPAPASPGDQNLIHTYDHQPPGTLQTPVRHGTWRPAQTPCPHHAKFHDHSASGSPQAW